MNRSLNILQIYFSLIKLLDLDKDKPAGFIIRLLFGFSSQSVFVKLNQNINKYYGTRNAVYFVHLPIEIGITFEARNWSPC